MRRLRPLLFVFVLAATTTMMIKADSEAGRVYADDLETHESRYKVRAKPEPYKPSKPAPSFDELSHFGEKRTASADAQDSRKAAVEDDYLRKKAKYNSAKRRRKLRKRKRKKNRPVVTTPSPLITTRGYLEVTPKSQPRPRPRHGKKKNKNNENRKTPFTAFTAAEYEDESVDQAGSFKSARAVPYHPSTPYDYSPTPSPTYGQPPSPHPSYQPPTPAAPAYSPSPAPYTPTTAYHSPSPSPYSPTPKPAYASPTPAPYTTSYSPGYQSPTPAYHPTTPKPPPPPPPPQPAYKRPPPPPPPPPAPAPVPYKAPQLPSLKYHPDPHPHDLDDDEYYEFEKRPYAFEYGVKDYLSGTDFSRVEESSGQVTRGSYKVALPDGRVQIVNYVADDNGYKASVTYEGDPVYPSPSEYRDALYEHDPVAASDPIPLPPAVHHLPIKEPHVPLPPPPKQQQQQQPAYVAPIYEPKTHVPAPVAPHSLHLEGIFDRVIDKAIKSHSLPRTVTAKPTYHQHQLHHHQQHSTLNPYYSPAPSIHTTSYYPTTPTPTTPAPYYPPQVQLHSTPVPHQYPSTYGRRQKKKTPPPPPEPTEPTVYFKEKPRRKSPPTKLSKFPHFEPEHDRPYGTKSLPKNKKKKNNKKNKKVDRFPSFLASTTTKRPRNGPTTTPYYTPSTPIAYFSQQDEQQQQQHQQPRVPFGPTNRPVTYTPTPASTTTTASTTTIRSLQPTRSYLGPYNPNAYKSFPSKNKSQKKAKAVFEGPYAPLATSEAPQAAEEAYLKPTTFRPKYSRELQTAFNKLRKREIEKNNNSNKSEEDKSKGGRKKKWYRRRRRPKTKTN